MQINYCNNYQCIVPVLIPISLPIIQSSQQWWYILISIATDHWDKCHLRVWSLCT